MYFNLFLTSVFFCLAFTLTGFPFSGTTPLTPYQFWPEASSFCRSPLPVAGGQFTKCQALFLLKSFQ